MTGIDTATGPLETASAPLSVALRLADDVDTARGSVIAAAGTLLNLRIQKVINAVVH